MSRLCRFRKSAQLTKEQYLIDQRVINMAETIRQALGVPVHVNVNSGCRCEKHNKAYSVVKFSKYLKGFAADLSCSKGANVMFETVKWLNADEKLPDYLRRGGNFRKYNLHLLHGEGKQFTQIQNALIITKTAFLLICSDTYLEKILSHRIQQSVC